MFQANMSIGQTDICQQMQSIQKDADVLCHQVTIQNFMINDVKTSTMDSYVNGERWHSIH